MVNIISDLTKRGEFTPDLKDLKRKTHVVLFVYDEMMHNGEDAFLLKKHCKYLGRARTHSNAYVLRRFGSGNKSYPILLEENEANSFKRGYVFGSAWAVPPEVLILLDEIKSNGLTYNRAKRSFLLIEQDTVLKSGARPYVQGHVYLGVEQFWKDMGLTLESSYISNVQGAGNGSKRRYYEYQPRTSSIWDNNLPWNQGYLY